MVRPIALLYLLVSSFLVTPCNAGVGTPACIAGCYAAAAPLGPMGIPVLLACIAACEAATACFDDLTVLSVNGTSVPVTGIVPGDLVDTLDEKTGALLPTLVTAIQHTAGDFMYVEISLSSGNAVNVTVPHMMLLCEQGSQRTTTMKRADLIQPRDWMVVWNRGQAVCTEVHAVRLFLQGGKWDVQTEAGTLLANGILASSFCERNLEKEGDASALLGVWRAKHNKVPALVDSANGAGHR